MTTQCPITSELYCVYDLFVGHTSEANFRDSLFFCWGLNVERLNVNWGLQQENFSELYTTENIENLSPNFDLGLTYFLVL